MSDDEMMRNSWRVFFNWRVLILLAMGFSSGLPLLLIGSTLKAWLSDTKISLTMMGFFSLASLPYTLKFLWSPLLDRFVPPFLGRRRGWLLISQISLAIAFVGLASCDPQLSLRPIAIMAFIIAFISATQDIALDAYRREILATAEFGFGNSVFITGYRLGMMFAGAFALFIASTASWHAAYLSMAVAVLVGLITTLLAPEPAIEHAPPRTMQEAFIGPFLDYLQRPGAISILLFIVFYKVADSMATEMTMPFYLQTGFTKIQVGSVVKLFGLWATIGGGLAGGALLVRLGLYRSLWIFGILQAISNMGFAWLSQIGPNVSGLMCVITAENFTAGMGTAAYVTLLASLTNKKYSATQYALLSSLASLPRVLLSAPTGYLATQMGWPMFFTFCTTCAIPGMLLLFYIRRFGVFAPQE